MRVAKYYLFVKQSFGGCIIKPFGSIFQARIWFHKQDILRYSLGRLCKLHELKKLIKEK